MKAPSERAPRGKYAGGVLEFISESGYKSQIVSHCKEEIVSKDLESIPSKPLCIITVWGGYKFNEQLGWLETK